jgi:hypothetical protein
MVLGKAVDSLLSGGPQQYFVDDQAPWPGEDEGDDLGHVVGGDLGLVVELLDAFPGLGMGDVSGQLGGDDAGFDEGDAHVGQQLLPLGF